MEEIYGIVIGSKPQRLIIKQLYSYLCIHWLESILKHLIVPLARKAGEHRTESYGPQGSYHSILSIQNLA